MNQFKARQNFIWKMAEKNTQTDYQKRLGQMFDQQYGQGNNQVNPQEDVFSAPIRPEVTMGTTGYGTRTPPIREYIYKRIQLKKQKGYPLSPKEKLFEERYLGLGSQVDTEGALSSLGLGPKEGTQQTEQPLLANDINEISLPPEIETGLQAKEWLMQNQGKSEEEAIDWLRNNDKIQWYQ